MNQRTRVHACERACVCCGFFARSIQHGYKATTVTNGLPYFGAATIIGGDAIHAAAVTRV